MSEYNFKHQTIRYLEVKKYGLTYTIEVIARKDEFDRVHTSIWVYVQGYKFKYHIKEEIRIIEDEEIYKEIEENIDYWIEDIDSFASSIT